MTDSILLDRDDAGIARITLNRPRQGNAIDIPMARALMEAAIACDRDKTVRCVVLTGAGDKFCTGGDVGAFDGAGADLSAFLAEITAYHHAAVTRLLRMPKPVVTAINGPAAGAGIGLALLGDIAVAAPSAGFSLAYTALGLSPDGAATWLLPRLVGLRRAQELCLLNRRVDAEEAAGIGLVTRVAVTDDALAEAMELARRLAASATQALGASRRLLSDSLETSLETQLDAESRAIADLSLTPDAREGIGAFAQRRRPEFTGEA